MYKDSVTFWHKKEPSWIIDVSSQKKKCIIKELNIFKLKDVVMWVKRYLAEMDKKRNTNASVSAQNKDTLFSRHVHPKH